MTSSPAALSPHSHKRLDVTCVIGWSGPLDPSTPWFVVLGMKPAGRDHAAMRATTSRTDWLLFILLGLRLRPTHTPDRIPNPTTGDSDAN